MSTKKNESGKIQQQSNLVVVSNRLPLDVEADQLRGMIESMMGVNSKVAERLKKRLAEVEHRLDNNLDTVSEFLNSC